MQHPTPAASASHGISSAAFRSALGRFATGVTIVTTCDEHGQPVGLTANSFNSVSLNPPLVLWSLSRTARTHAAFSRNPHYAVHVLAADQQPLAARFATKDIDRFAGLAWQPGLGEVPILDGALAVFECRKTNQHDEGDHVIFVGEVLRCALQRQAAPLIYHGGQYFTELPL